MHADRVGDGGAHGWGRRDDRHLADAADAVGVSGVRDLDDDRIDHRQVERRGHAVVEQAGVLEVAGVVVVVLLVQRHADALGDAALHLAFDVGRVDRGTGVLDGGVAEDIDLARVGIDLDIDDVRRKGGTR